MSKRIFSIVLAMLLLVPFVLTFASCNKERTEEEIINDIINSGTIALTLSVWVPTNSDTESEDFQKRLIAVEDSINEILRDKNYSTKIKLTAVSSDEYEEKLKAHIADIEKKVENKNGILPSNISQGYVNEAEKIIYGDSYIYELAYPDVHDTQIDIFMIRNYEDYVTYAQSTDSKGRAQIYNLFSYISKLGGTYSDIHRMIVPEVLEQYILGTESIYAIPNNHLFAKDYYQYILINKNAFDNAESDVEIDSITDIFACEAFINAIGANAESGYVPFVGSLNDAPNIFNLDTSNMVGGSNKNPTPSSIFDMEEYNKYVELYKKLNDNGYVKESLAEGEEAAVSFFYGSSIEAKEYADEYYLIKSEMPVAAEESFSSMFAISKYSANYDRAMSILYLLLTNSEIITLLQYGIEDEDYTIEINENDEEVIKVSEDTSYDMSNLNLGNSYHTYIGDGAAIDDWDYVKEINYDVVSNPYMSFNSNFEKNATKEEKDKLAELKAAVNAIASEVNVLIKTMTLEEYKEFLKLHAIDIAEINEKIAEAEENLTTETDEAKLAQIQTELNSLKATKAEYEGNEAINKLFATDDYKNLIELYNELYTKYN